MQNWSPGQPAYWCGFMSGSNKLVVTVANFVHRRGSWARWRNTKTGDEWNEQGDLRYDKTALGAIRSCIQHQAGLFDEKEWHHRCTSLDPGQKTAPNADKEFERLRVAMRAYDNLESALDPSPGPEPT